VKTKSSPREILKSVPVCSVAISPVAKQKGRAQRSWGSSGKDARLLGLPDRRDVREHARITTVIGGQGKTSAIQAVIWRDTVGNKLTTIFVAVIGLLAVSVPLFAHHGNAAYDVSKVITVKGTVTEWFWANPHCFLKFDAQDEKGEVQHWVVEANNVPSMSNAGWAKSSFKPGDEVTVTMTPARNGRTVGRFSGRNSVVLNGHHSHQLAVIMLPMPSPRPSREEWLV
jgi:hypothetical protein